MALKLDLGDMNLQMLDYSSKISHHCVTIS